MKFFLCFVLCGALVNSYAQKGTHESVVFEKPPVIDGKMEDWTAEWWLDPDGKFLSNVGSDAENLYFRLKISDDLTQQKIGLFGLTLRLNPNGKKKGKVGLKYPIGKDVSELKKDDPQTQTINSSSAELAARIQLKKELINDVEVVELLGLAKNNIVSSRLGLNNGIEVIIVAQDDGSYIYEAKIPFKAFNINKSTLELLGVEFETGRLVVQTKNNTNSNYAPSSRGGGAYGGQQQMNYNSYHYNPLSSPGYIWLGIKFQK